MCIVYKVHFVCQHKQVISNFCLPLKTFLGFVEDYTRIVMNIKQEPILLRTSTVINAMVQADAQEANGVLKLQKID